ncbi:hypothetical protein [Pelagimonas varians]|uniref:Orc1-like AAA ATPase domain-containing protein n=1 Tax=Pelagimonas varians TaxID=696760 RepID=A0A238JWQ2_9RHOB|nr:hypothetical protein [Pelagimonas varians]PYG34373.1 hypothetical protein C8N36_10123 [Pelagimonas varians]SMX34262.1 hypothetical protein PEV8663_00442 [Pelagimonas varians]
MSNPFSVKPPEDLTPQNIADNFVEMYTDFPSLKEPMNLFIHGPRGAGKSIMLRSLERQVQLLITAENREQLPFFAIHIPIKREFFGNPEFLRLEGWKATTVGEHLLTVHAAQYLCDALFENCVELTESSKAEFSGLWEDCGGGNDSEAIEAWNSFEDASRFCERETRRVRQYYVRLPEVGDSDVYNGALTGLSDFLLLFVRALIAEGSVKDGPVCFMVDDADNLPEDLQRVLNSWVSARVAKLACFKVTTQLAYKTFKTMDGRIIESPHDFSEINIGSVYTSNKGNFAKRIEAIVAKRLKNAGIERSPDDFFPKDRAQQTRRDEILEDLRQGRAEPYIALKGDGPSRSKDLAQRYAIPALMREAAATKSAHTFSYAGLQSLTDLSSGVVRWFLQPASQMYSAVQSGIDQVDGSDKVTEIPVSVQDSEIAIWSKEFREKLNVDPGGTAGENSRSSLQSMGHSKENYEMLGNLLDAIGAFCRERLLDKTASEQRVFSFALNDDPNRELSEILHLGVRLGYLQKTDLASKNTLGGRRPRYILSRRLGPHYRLDVSGYAAHLSVTCQDLTLALKDPKSFVRNRLNPAKKDDGQATIDFGEPQ